MRDFILYVVLCPIVLFVVFVLGFGSIDRKFNNRKLSDEPILFIILALMGTGLLVWFLDILEDMA